MRSLLLGLAAPIAALALPAPATAEHRDDDAPRVVHPGARGFACGVAPRQHRRDGDGHRRHRGGFVDCLVVPGYFGPSADWDGNRSFDADRWNDWWHERPWRAYPRWVQEQRGRSCTEDRMWWSGTGWRC